MVERGDLVVHAFGRGTIESQREAAVGFDLVGRISDILVDEGDTISLGQELALLETEQAQADLRSAQMGVVAARASLRRISAEEERARALLVTAAREAERADKLFTSGTITAKSHDEASDRLRLARAELDRVLASRSEATRGIDVAVGGAEQRRMTMVRATLLAPFDGLVTRRLREPGDTVVVGSAVLRIVDPRRVYVSAAIDETVLADLAIDQPSQIFFPETETGSGTGTTFDGTVSRISWEADRQTHEILVEVTPKNLDRRIAIGQRADVRIEIKRKPRVLQVPIQMIHRDEEGPYVYVDRGGKIAKAHPAFGLTGDAVVEVTDGLAESDTLLAARQPNKRELPVGRRWARR
ncbi:MAG: efflux RND transporter periplasmic adaptor subunit [Deltaproteobacteria bacterium]|nr:efflux RND transporter periplasmic adaptor subunit [Deltaproteobacteria bacterium]